MRQHYVALHTTDLYKTRTAPELSIESMKDIYQTLLQDGTPQNHQEVFNAEHPTILWLPGNAFLYHKMHKHIIRLLSNTPHTTFTCIATRDVGNATTGMLQARDFLDEWKPPWWSRPRRK